MHSLKVVTDALVSMFDEFITKNESGMQRLIRVVDDHRKITESVIYQKQQNFGHFEICFSLIFTLINQS